MAHGDGHLTPNDVIRLGSAPRPLGGPQELFYFPLSRALASHQSPVGSGCLAPAPHSPPHASLAPSDLLKSPLWIFGFLFSSRCRRMKRKEGERSDARELLSSPSLRRNPSGRFYPPLLPQFPHASSQEHPSPGAGGCGLDPRGSQPAARVCFYGNGDKCRRDASSCLETDAANSSGDADVAADSPGAWGRAPPAPGRMGPPSSTSSLRVAAGGNVPTQRVFGGGAARTWMGRFAPGGVHQPCRVPVVTALSARVGPTQQKRLAVGIWAGKRREPAPGCAHPRAKGVEKHPKKQPQG